MVLYNTYQTQPYVVVTASFGQAHYVHHGWRIPIINHYGLDSTPNAPNGAQKRYTASKSSYHRGKPSLPKVNPEMQIQHRPPGEEDYGV